MPDSAPGADASVAADAPAGANLGENAGYVGGGVFSADGEDQNVRREAVAGHTGRYFVKVENTSVASDHISLHGTRDGRDGGDNDDQLWTIRYFAARQGGVEITDQICAEAGWQTPELAPGETYEVRVEITPPGGAPGGSEQTATILAALTQDEAAVDAVTATLAVPDPSVPPATAPVDLLIRNLQDPLYQGENEYNATGAAQTRNQAVAANATAVYALKVVGRAASSSYKVSGPGTESGWTARYFDALTGGNNITADIEGDGWETPLLAEGESCELRVEVTPSEAVPPQTARSLLIAAQGAQGDPDVVKAVTTNIQVAVDALIRNGDELYYAGEDIINLDGAGQTKTQPAAQGTTAIFHVKVESKGEQAERLQVLGLPGTGGRTVHYYDALTGGQDITAQVTGDGWLTPELGPGQSYALRVEITSETPVSSNTPVTALYHIRTEKADPDGGAATIQEYNIVLSAGDVTAVLEGQNVGPAHLGIGDPCPELDVTLTPLSGGEATLVQVSSSLDPTKIDSVKCALVPSVP